MEQSGFLFKHHKIIMIITGLLFVAISPIMPVESLVLAVGLCFGVIIYYNPPKYAIGIMLLMLPFSNTPILQAQLVSAVPLKLFVITFAALFMVILLKYKMNLRTYFDYKYFALALLYVIIFSVSVFKALDYIEYISLAWQDELSPVRMISNLLITPPLIMLLPALIVLLYYNYEDYHQIVYAFLISMFILSVTILYLYVFMIPNKFNFSAIRRQIGSVVGLHGNDIANFYIMTFPILLVMYLNSSKLFVKLTFYLSLFAIAILFSRTAYVCVIFTFFAYGFLRGGKIDKRFFGLLVVLAIGMLFLPQAVYDRFATLVAGSDVNTLTAGRTESIWKPLLFEWIREPLQTKLMGIGRYSIVESFAYRTGIILDVKHPHNMYFEAIMDIGVFGFLGYLFIYFYIAWESFLAFLREKKWL